MGEARHSILIADDCEADRFFLKEAIRRHAPKLQVIGEVSDGEQVIEYLSGEGIYADRELYPLPEVLILDVRMPEMNGMEVAEWLKQQNFPSLKVAMLADSSSMMHKEKAMSLGVKHFYSKLVNSDERIQMVIHLQNELEGITQGRISLNAAEIPPLVVDGASMVASNMPVIVIWGNGEVSRFFTLAGAKAAFIAGYYLKKDSRVNGARVFEWDGTAWKQMIL